MKLLLTGGLLRPDGFELGEGKYYGAAKLLRVDMASGHVEALLSIDQGTGNFPPVDPNLEFTVATSEPGVLWLAMDTEIRRYSYPSLQLQATYSHPCFQNVHSVAIRGDELYVTSTGLDMVAVLRKGDGALLRVLNTDGKPTWHRFSENVDYRQVYSTRPHDCHPNFVLWIDDQPWVTRCTQEDIVALHDVTQRIDISGNRRPISIHDGIVQGELAYFTTVDGGIVIVDLPRRAVLETIDLYALRGFGGFRGWCRGLQIDGDICRVAFSRLRKTRRLEKIAWVKGLLGRGKIVEDASVLEIDLKRRIILNDLRIPHGMIDAIYSVLPEPV